MVLVIALGIIGLFLVFLEFFLPGGIFAIGGALFLISSIILFFMLDPSFYAILIYFAVLIVAIIAICKLALRQIKRSGKKSTFFSGEDQEGYRASSYRSDLIGKQGTALSDLKPAGHVMIEEERFQAVSESGYVSQGTTIEVIGGEGGHLIIKKTEG